ncbi:non-hydrolyzing UDP-N-acetylglucosamine 2-epimerase [Oceanibacterium hippocampi]|uniref:UDP-2,3-diacetamido-2,3-dideoxy-D-glucuronate 2-epimerase n=1 Tax=Oceanibacterium hippocampi TaxID=745714 RepID=A0A1Y5RQB9_9PROT|nr:UDP-N-acetylglucosamine 2-epimerase (non-hydrolyzing) [Oceanibacterium hippocampi]SLN22886.1 UDP-2,3-diacetamido-2,3-dideoxy-D-glucuronate 2-epimerase [Oceanibacterium hippocampi]
MTQTARQSRGQPFTILTVVGARPQFVKAAAVSRALRGQSGMRELLVHTGQHFDREMSALFFEELELPEPVRNLEIGGGSHGAMTGRMLAALETAMTGFAPDAVLVYGDTNSTLAGALAAAKLAIPVIHVEAGLRSNRRSQPEEINRVVADRLSTMLLCPTRAAIANLERENVPGEIRHVGDVMYDATLFALERVRDRLAPLDRLGLRDRNYAVATLHRAENVDDGDRLRRLVDYLRTEAKEQPVVLPLHPRTRERLSRFDVDTTGLLLTSPLGYLEMTRLLAGAAHLFTDSGGMQKEAYFHRVPCTTLRDETEWVETVEAGWNRLWQGGPRTGQREIADYGTGTAAARAVEAIRHHFRI